MTEHSELTPLIHCSVGVFPNLNSLRGYLLKHPCPEKNIEDIEEELRQKVRISYAETGGNQLGDEIVYLRTVLFPAPGPYETPDQQDVRLGLLQV